MLDDVHWSVFAELITPSYHTHRYSDGEEREYGAVLDDLTDVLRFDKVRLASSEGEQIVIA